MGRPSVMEMRKRLGLEEPKPPLIYVGQSKYTREWHVSTTPIASFLKIRADQVMRIDIKALRRLNAAVGRHLDKLPPEEAADLRAAFAAWDWVGEGLTDD